MRYLIVIICLAFASNALAYDPIDAITVAIEDEYGDRASNVQPELNDILSFIGTGTMNLTHETGKALFGNWVRDYEVMYRISFDLDGEKQICRALVKSATRRGDVTAKVSLTGCGMNLAQLVVGAFKNDYTGPEFLKAITYKDGRVESVQNARYY